MDRSIPLHVNALAAFRDQFGRAPSVAARAPGRVELLGNHTDYNRGWVLACAIDRQTLALAAPRDDRTVRAVSVDRPEPIEFAFDEPAAGRGRWGDYVQGVVVAWSRRFGPLPRGFDLVVAGDVPIGAGLSSSASLESAVALILAALGGATEIADDRRMELAHLVQEAENCAVGVACGLLDPFASLMGREEFALVLDCREESWQRVPFGADPPALVICDSGTSRQLAEGMYNRRRSECERIAAFYGVPSLREVEPEHLAADWDRLEAVPARRARHVLSENERVRAGAEALVRGDVAELGRQMLASHASSRDDFENSSQALDALIAAAEEAPGFLGGKLSGAGWAGCTVNLVARGREQEFAEAVIAGYRDRTGLEARAIPTMAAEGAAIIPVG